MPVTSFDLHAMGWKAFEDLVGCVLSSVMGQTYQVFSAGVDGGRDGFFEGHWKQTRGETLAGRFVVQCKHTSRQKQTLTKDAIEVEAKKIARIVHDKGCDSYILVTNHSLSAGKVAFFDACLKQAGVTNHLVLGSEWIDKTISENPTLRRLVPRLYGLGDLTQIITGQAYAQARRVLDGLLADLGCFVPTDAYRQSAHALSDVGFVLLLGEPASGKTMIANLLAVSAADQWGFETLMLTTPADFDHLWNPNDPGQFIWVDDAFGSTQYDPGRVREWNHRLPKLKAAIHGGAKVVFTSRDYIFRSARSELKTSAFELFEDSKVTIHVEKLSDMEKQQILYNHLKFGRQNRDFLLSVLPHLEAATSVSRFLPEVARRLASPRFTKQLIHTDDGLIDFFENPRSVLEDVITNMGLSERAAIALVFINGGSVPSPIVNTLENMKLLENMGAPFADVKRAFDALSDSFLSRSISAEGWKWKFRHPTIGDAFASVIASNPELVDVYLSGVTTERLLGEVSCGDLGIEGVKIVLAADRFTDVLARIGALEAKNLHHPFSRVTSFLATRCSPEFLALWLASIGEPDFLPDAIWYVTAFDASLTLARTLRRMGLLSEPVRLKIVKRISDLSDTGRSMDFMKDRIVGGLLTEEERRSLYVTIAEATLQNTHEIVEEIHQEWDRSTDPSDSFHDITSTLHCIRENGTGQDVAAAEAALEEITSRIQKMEEQREDRARSEALDTEDSIQLDEPQLRSIFDDLVD